jgi:hypothetical protein
MAMVMVQKLQLFIPVLLVLWVAAVVARPRRRSRRWKPSSAR